MTMTVRPHDAIINIGGSVVRCAGAWTSLRLQSVEVKLESLHAPPSGRVFLSGKALVSSPSPAHSP
ncbi:MAG: hypothetical protein M3329_02095 [Pseudomonadota bacterium]|nr:hypothetical protein [Pseudomonadota bacterium]